MFMTLSTRPEITEDRVEQIRDIIAENPTWNLNSHKIYTRANEKCFYSLLKQELEAFLFYKKP